MGKLNDARNELHQKLLDKSDPDALTTIQENWRDALNWISKWWTAYQEWERKDTFNKAVQDNRMTMRSFGSAFDYQVSKVIPVNITTGRFYDEKRVQLKQDQHEGPYAQLGLTKHKRGIDTSEYAKPENFASRKAKYDMGLHDISVRLVVPGSNIKDSCHHKAQENPHFCFLPLSKGEDQYVLYELMRYAKSLRTAVPTLDALVRSIRSKMTRVKLASDYDMGTGYVAVPTPDRNDKLTYKVSYSVGNTLKERGKLVPPRTTIERLQQRQKMYFFHRSDIVKFTANEVVIAMRRHAGDFPVYAVYDEGVLKVFDIIGGTKVIDPTKTISVTGVANW